MTRARRVGGSARPLRVAAVVTLVLSSAGAGCAGSSERDGPGPAPAKAAKPGPASPAPESTTSEDGASTATPAADIPIVDLDVDFHRKRLHARTAGPADGQAVLLLHGQKYDSHTWEQLGTLGVLAANGLHAVALDIPGYGKSEPLELEAETFLQEVIPALGLTRPVIVAPSMSGHYAFPFVVAHPDAVAGFVPVAPVGVYKWITRLQGNPVPTLVVWGGADTVISVSEADPLAEAFKHGRKLVLDGAMHAAYLERTQEFHEALVEFVREATAGRPAGG